MMIMAIRKDLILKLSMLLAGSLLVFVFISGYVNLINESKKNFERYPQVTATYKDIFPAINQKFLKEELTYFSKHNNPVATFKDLRDNKKIIVFKLDLVADIDDVEKILEIFNTGNTLSAGIVYNNTKILSNYEIYRFLYNQVFKKISFSIEKSTHFTEIEKSDSIKNFACAFKTITISNNLSRIPFLHIVNLDGKASISEDCLFYRRKAAVYFLIKEKADRKANDLLHLFKNEYEKL